ALVLDEQPARCDRCGALQRVTTGPGRHGAAREIGHGHPAMLCEVAGARGRASRCPDVPVSRFPDVRESGCPGVADDTTSRLRTRVDAIPLGTDPFASAPRPGVGLVARRWFDGS